MPDQPFTVLAPYYDRLVEDVNYARWADYILRLLERFGTPPIRRVLELACGTGNFLKIFADKGLEVTGLDLSEPMLTQARKKLGKRARLVQGDMTAFDLGETFDAAYCVFDSLNYLQTEEEVFQTFRQTWKHLKPGGVFVFDINTPFCLRFYWNHRIVVKEAPGLFSVWQNDFDPDREISTLRLTVFVGEQDGRYRRLEELHTEKAHDPKRIQTLAFRAGFTEVHPFEHLTQNPPQHTTLRITYAAVKR